MTATAPVPSDLAAYLARVRDALGDLPADERDDLLAEVEVSLHDAATESGGSVAARLGPPEEFAAELRSAAGLQPSEARPPQLGFRDAVRRFAASSRVRAARGVLGQLAPIWWAVRGYVVVAALALLFDVRWSTSHPSVPRVLGSPRAGVVAIALAVVASVAVGLWKRRASGVVRVAIVAANVVVLAAAIPVVHHLAQRAPREVVVEVTSEPTVIPGLAYNGNPVANIYPYSRDGRLLHDVLLYTAAGAPLNVSTKAYDPYRRVVRRPDGTPILNAFPVRYYEPGTKVVLHPNAAPHVVVPRVATPSLETTKAAKAKAATVR